MKKSIKYFVTVGIGLLIALAVALSKNLFAQTNIRLIYAILSDSFLTAGVLVTGFGLLLFVTNEGVFDGLKYGFKVLAQMFKKHPTPVKETYYDYRTARGRSKVSFGYIVICGAAFLAICILFIILYESRI